MYTLIVDARLQDIVRGLVPTAVQIKVLDLFQQDEGLEYPFNCSILAAICLAGEEQVLRRVLADGPFSKIPIFAVDSDRPEACSGLLIKVLVDEVQSARRDVGEARMTAARLRVESIETRTRLREIENLLHTLGNPQLSSALAWQPTGRMLTISGRQKVAQYLPINVVSLTAVDLWFPEVVLPLIRDLAVEIEDAAGQVYPLQVASPDMGLETGWLRFVLAEPAAGVGRSCLLRILNKGKAPVVLGLGQPVPDGRFSVKSDPNQSQDETLALRIWHSIGGVRLPNCTPIFSSSHPISIDTAHFVRSSDLPRPELFSVPPNALDHVSTAFWDKEDAVMVHPSRSGPACAIIRDVDLAGLSHVAALVTVGHARAPHLNFAIGVAPHGVVDEDGLWQRRLGPWITGLPPHSWAQAHCIPVEPITGSADLLLAVSLAADVPNDLSWGLFRGFRFSRGGRNCEE